jgi:hypothetical protein
VPMFLHRVGAELLLITLTLWLQSAGVAALIAWVRRRRVESVTPHSPRQWGTMEVDQMLHHLNLACGGSLGFYNLPDESYLTSRTFFKWILVEWFPEQPVGLRLPAGFKIAHSQKFEFAYEKAQLLKILEADWNARTADAWKRILCSAK